MKPNYADIHAWEWAGAWHAVLDQQPLYTCNTRVGIVDWIHGYTGICPTEDKIHDASQTT